jgi:hypothetical protein
LKQAYAGNADPKARLDALAKVSPKGYQAEAKFQLEQQKSQREAEKAKLEQGLKHFEVVGQIMSGVRDQSTYDAARQQMAQMFGPEAAANLSPSYDPQAVERSRVQAMSVKDQMEQQWKKLHFGLENANKPFSLDEGGQAVPNQPAQKFLKDKAAAGKPNINLAVNTEKGFLGEVAKGVGNSVETSMNQAKGAASTLNSINQIRSALDSGKVITGPGADTRVLIKQLGVTLGLGGKDDAEILTNTRSLIQGMASQELSGAEALKGQGQVTEGERALVKRAASGDINMTEPEIRTLMTVLDKTSRLKLRSHADNVKRLGANPNAGPIADFMRVDEPPAYSAPAKGAGGFRYLGKE